VLAQRQGLFFSCFLRCPTSEQPGGAQEVGSEHSRYSWPKGYPRLNDSNRPKGYPRPNATVLRNKSWQKEEAVGLSEWWHLSSQVTVMHDGTLVSWRWLNTCLLRGNSKWISSYALLALAAFTLPTKLPLSHPMSSHTFSLLILSPVSLGRSKWVDQTPPIKTFALGLCKAPLRPQLPWGEAGRTSLPAPCAVHQWLPWDSQGRHCNST